jgi:hypothetical protein
LIGSASVPDTLGTPAWVALARSLCYQAPNGKEDAPTMDRNGIFGGSPLAVAVRLALISIAVGIVLSALGINLRNFFDRINELLRAIYDLGFGAIDWVLQYLLLGAIIVVPIWVIARVAAILRRPAD